MTNDKPLPTLPTPYVLLLVSKTDPTDMQVWGPFFDKQDAEEATLTADEQAKYNAVAMPLNEPDMVDSEDLYEYTDGK